MFATPRYTKIFPKNKTWVVDLFFARCFFQNMFFLVIEEWPIFFIFFISMRNKELEYQYVV